MNHAYATRTFAGSTSHASVLTTNVVELTSNFVNNENGSKWSTVDCHSNEPFFAQVNHLSFKKLLKQTSHQLGWFFHTQNLGTIRPLA